MKIILVYQIFIVLLFLFSIERTVATIKKYRNNHKIKTALHAMSYAAVMVVLLTVTYIIFDVPDRPTVKGEETTVIRTLAEITHPEIIKGVRTVHYGERTDLPFLSKHQLGTSNGYYNALLRTITIPSHINQAYVEEVWWHEIGHNVWFLHMTPKEQEAFARAANNTQNAPTLYASIGGVEEDWAESFMAYVHESPGVHPEWLEREGKQRINVVMAVIERMTGCAEPECVYTHPELII